MARTLKIINKIQNFISSIIGISLILMMLVVFLQTFTRFVIFYSLPWSEELSRYLFVTLILLGINLTIRDDMLVRIDLIDNIKSKKITRLLEILRYVIALVVSSVFLYSTFGLIKIGSFQKSPAMQIPMNIVYYVILIGFLMSTISILVKIIEIFRIDKI